jgi:hypothetical protein
MVPLVALHLVQRADISNIIKRRRVAFVAVVALIPIICVAVAARHVVARALRAWAVPATKDRCLALAVAEKKANAPVEVDAKRRAESRERDRVEPRAKKKKKTKMKKKTKKKKRRRTKSLRSRRIQTITTK